MVAIAVNQGILYKFPRDDMMEQDVMFTRRHECDNAVSLYHPDKEVNIDKLFYLEFDVSHKVIL